MQDRLKALADKATAAPISRLQSGVEESRFPDMAEPALIHPFLSSVVKLRNNGAIDIFTSTNQGIRIDAISQTVNIICDGEKEHLGYLRTWIQRDLEEWVGTNVLRVIGGTDTKEVKGDIVIRGESNMNVTIKGNVNLKVNGNIDINNKGTVNWKSGGIMHFSAPKYYFD